MQMAADLPKHYSKHMDAFSFIKNVPVDWSERKIINSEFLENMSQWQEKIRTQKIGMSEV